MKARAIAVVLLIIAAGQFRAEAETLVSAPPYSSTSSYGNHEGDCAVEPEENTSAGTNGSILLELIYQTSCDISGSEVIVRGSADLTKTSSLSLNDGEELTGTIRYRVDEASGNLDNGGGRHDFRLGFDLSDQEDAYAMTCDGAGNCSSQVILDGSCTTTTSGNCSPTGNISPGTHELSYLFTVDCGGPLTCALPYLRTFASTEFTFYTEYAEGSTVFLLDILSLTYSNETPPPPPPPPAKKLYGLGDSVAAAFGLGPDGNPSSYPEQVLSHWGEAREYIGDNLAVSGATSQQVIDNQLPQIINENSNLVLLTVGADDVRFAQCAKAYVLAAEENPCQGAMFAQALTNLKTNLETIFTLLTNARVMVTEYYNPLPPSAGLLDDLCDIYYVPAAIKVAAESLLGLGAEYNFLYVREEARKIQNEAWSYAEGVVQALNSAIRQAAAGFPNVSVVEIDSAFAGHDACKGPGVAWVFGFEGNATFRFFGGTQSFTYSMPFSCPDQSRDPGVFDTSAEKYEIHLRINCAPHPTFEGQVALRDAVIAGL